MKIFISGIESFVGKKLVSYCNENSIEYFGIDKNSQDTKNTKCLDINSSEIFKYIDKESVVVHLAAISTDKDCKKDINLAIKTNIDGTINLFNNSVKAGCKKFIFASSEWVYGDINSQEVINEDYRIDMHRVNSIYAITKFSAENLLKNITTEIQRIVLRFGIIYSERHEGNLSALERLFLDVKQNDIVTVGSKKNARKFIHIDDIISGIILACNCKKVLNYEIFNLCGDELITLEKIINMSASILKKEVKIFENSSNQIVSRNIDNTKAKLELDWSPRTIYNESLKILSKKLK